MNELLRANPRIKWSMQERDAWVGLYRESSQTVEEFYRQNDFPKAKLLFWLESLEEGPSENVFVEVSRIELPAPAIREPVVTATKPSAATPAPAPASAAAVALQLPSGMRIEVPVGLDMAWFGRMLQAIADAKA